MEKRRKERVAIVGSGMAGLTTAYLLNNDLKQRYQVELFESGESLSLDSASHSVLTPEGGAIDRIDMPMRAFAGGFYKNLIAMYTCLGMEYRSQRFVFQFTTADGEGTSGKRVPYFIHTSNNHQLPPAQPDGMHILVHVIGVLYVSLWYFWFSICCFLVPPRSKAGDGQHSESFREYASRVKIPQHFMQFYLLPLMSSVATCPHADLLNFPASDIIAYKRLSNRQEHFVLSHGAGHAEQELSRGLHVHFSARVVKVESHDTAVEVWHEVKDQAENVITKSDLFDKVVLAVSPGIVQHIFEPVSGALSTIPTIEVHSVLHTAAQKLPVQFQQRHKIERTSTCPQIINLHTSVSNQSRTEAVHLQPSGYVVTTCPLTAVSPSTVTKTAKFPRVLRTPQSRDIVNRIFRDDSKMMERSETSLQSHWRNGDAGVWLAGGWCWDGMVLLEGCIVSAMRIAKDLDVNIPWEATQ